MVRKGTRLKSVSLLIFNSLGYCQSSAKKNMKKNIYICVSVCSACLIQMLKQYMNKQKIKTILVNGSSAVRRETLEFSKIRFLVQIQGWERDKDQTQVSLVQQHPSHSTYSSLPQNELFQSSFCEVICSQFRFTRYN